MRLSVAAALALASSCAALQLGAPACRAGAAAAAAAAAPARARSRSLRAIAPAEVTPLYNQLLVELRVSPTETSGGVLLPTAFMDDFDAFITPKLRYGTVIAKGPGGTGVDGSPVPMLDIAVGQRVVVAPTGGQKVVTETDQVEETSSVHVFDIADIWGVV